MCTIATWPEISVGLSVEEARRIVRDALHKYDEALRWAFASQGEPSP